MLIHEKLSELENDLRCIHKEVGSNTIENYVILPIISQREIIYSQKLLVTLQFRPDTCRINIETTKQLQL